MTYDYRLYIDGAWKGTSVGAPIPLIDPATERQIGVVARASDADLEAALASSVASRTGWAAVPAAERGRMLCLAADLLAPRLNDAARALSDEQGKTIAEAAGEYQRALEALRWNGENADRLEQPIRIDDARVLQPEPIGIVAAFTPWNYPAVLNARKLAAALAAGCPVILKGAEETPSSAVFIIEALIEAGIPKGVVNLVFGDPPKISATLLASPDVRVMTFTGSTAVGRQLAAMAGTNLQRCVLELGGHSPVALFADADLDVALPAILDYKFECAGQSCNAPSRLLVEDAIYDEVLARIVDACKAITVGPGNDAATVMGPMANIRRIEAMERLTKDAVACGAKLLTGGSRLDRDGFFWSPTILAEVPESALVLTEEPFGPLLTVQRFSGVDEAITLSNSTSYGLASYFFTRSPEIEERMVRSLSSGSVSVNRIKGVSADAPNGGVNDSGYGYEGGVEGYRTFQNLKLINRPEL